MSPTTNLFDLALAGAVYLRRLAAGPNAGAYIMKPGKRGATHKLHATRIHPRILPRKVTPPKVIHCIYHDEANPVSFPDTIAGRRQADEWVDARRVLAANALPLSAVAVPIGVRYKNFVQRRTEAAKDGSLYEKKQNKPKATMAKNQKATSNSNAGKDRKNDITRPKEGTVTRKVWDAADRLQERAAVFAECNKRKINPATIATQYGKWRQYNGLTGRTAKPATKRKPAPPAKRKPAPPAKRKPAPPAAAPAASGR